MAVPPFVQMWIDRLDSLIKQVDDLPMRDVIVPVSGRRVVGSLARGFDPTPTRTEKRLGESETLNARITQAIRDIAPGSAYDAKLKDCTYSHQFRNLAQALRDDLVDGYFNGAHALAHAEVFEDFLEMAQYLLEQTFKDAAAVISGSSAEAHLRQLAIAKYPVIQVTDQSGRPFSGGYLNDQLHKAGAYDKANWKLMAAWQTIRNDAAHGHYHLVDIGQVGPMIQGIRSFMVNHPA